jgi:RIO kinase 2
MTIHFVGYRLSYLGFDILALKAFLSRGVIASVGSQIGVGKESDIFEAQDPEGNEVVIKIHRLGRTSFRAVRRCRDYMNGKSKASWLYMSRLAAIKEFAFMKALHAHGFPTPVPIDQSRHIVAMSRIAGFPLSQIKAGKMAFAEEVFLVCLALLKRLAEHGLVHCDFNEFNLMIDNEFQVTLIDFPQMVSTLHPNAEELFNRDLNGLVKFFAMKMRYIPPDYFLIKLSDVAVSETRIDEEVRASGFSESEDQELLGFITDSQAADAAAREAGETLDEEDEEEDEEDVVGDEEGAAEAPCLVSVENTDSTAANETMQSIFDFKSKNEKGLSHGKEDVEGDEEEEESGDDDDIEDILDAGEAEAEADEQKILAITKSTRDKIRKQGKLDDGHDEVEVEVESDISDEEGGGHHGPVAELSEEALKQAKETARK